MKSTILLIMAAGIGSRYGAGVKQLVKMDERDHIIMDYSIHDAIAAGFNKIIFVIRKDIEKDFKDIIGNRIEGICGAHNVKVDYVFQNLEDIPGEKPAERTKPWGTGQAVLAAEKLLDAPFAVINADDYYGKEAFVKVHDWLVKEHKDFAVAMAGFILKNTLSENGGVTRGICVVEEGHTHIVNVIETKNIVPTETGVEADGVSLDPNGYVSMNFWGFPGQEGQKPEFVNVLNRKFKEFFEIKVIEDPLKAEFLLPTIIGGLLQEGKATVKVLETQDKWFGVTYAEDKDAVVASFEELLQKGVYKLDLYSDLA